MLPTVRIHYHVYSAPAPIGLLFLAATEQGLRHVEFLDRRSIKRVIAGHSLHAPGAEWQASLLALKDATDQLNAYFHGQLRSFDLPLDPVGSEFQIAVWRALSTIPYGQTRSYGDIARAIGQPRAARAVGLANNQNPIAIVVPCHRVIGSDRSLVGYGGGIARKRFLLEHEARFGSAVVRAGENTEIIPVTREEARAVAVARPASKRVAPKPRPRPRAVRARGSARLARPVSRRKG